MLLTDINLLLVIILLILSVVILTKKNRHSENYCVKISPFSDEYCNCGTGCMTKS